MWPPARHPFYPFPQARPPLPCPPALGPQAFHNVGFIPFAGVAPVWHQMPQNGDSWKPPPGNESWRLHRQHNPWSNHDLYRPHYSQIPKSVPHPQIPFSGAEDDSRAMTTEPDYERQLREQYERPQEAYCDFSENKIEVHAETSARKIKLSWKIPILSERDNSKYKINLVVQLEELEGGIGRGARKGELGLIVNRILPIHVTRTEFEAIPGSLYSIGLNVIGQKNETVAKAKLNERAMFSLDEIKVLLQKALNFTGPQMQQFTYLYRCKPKIYWDYLYNERGQIMHTYTKDSNGQAATPINQNIDGLFFSARTNPDGSLPMSSPFGDIRMVIPAMTLLDPSKINLYFADFYCNRVTHYVTVVVAFPGTAADNYCKKKLVKLDPFNNLFLQFQATPNPNVPLLYFVNKKVWVEIFYTENVSMRWGRFDNIQAAGMGTSKIGGLPHNKHCRTCNLYPIGVSATPQLPEDIEQIPEEKAEMMVKEAIKAEFVENSDDSCSDDFEPLVNGCNKAENGEELLTYGELKSRLEKLEEKITQRSPKRSDNGDMATRKDSLSHNEDQLMGLIRDISQFMEQMENDFTVFASNIENLERQSQIFFPSSEKISQMYPSISGTVDALIDSPTQANSPRREERSKRIRKLSFNMTYENKRRRDSL